MNLHQRIVRLLRLMRIWKADHEARSESAGAIEGLADSQLEVFPVGVCQESIQSIQKHVFIPKPEDSVIAEDAVMTGSLKVGGRLIVQGTVSGRIEQKAMGANVYLDSMGVVRGQVDASNALLCGVLEGSVTASAISIEDCAHVTGIIEFATIRIKGGVANVQLISNDSLLRLVEDAETQKAIAS